ncbi:calreticulin-like isoform X1 [Tursiops truncatus]|uniref:calreticulin-like isoform X1 n=1 Tax=Tursiops truncatus TaxID=9739 RepID=UPI003CCEF98E
MPSFMPLSTRYKKPFSNENETLVVQFSVKHKQGIHCGGGFVKLFPDTLNQEDMHSESEYYIMFGPDICGFGNNKVQVIPHYQGRYHENNKTIKPRINKDTHLYTLIIRPDATYEVKIDNQQVAAGDLEDDWDFLPPRKIKAPYTRKPRKWDERLQTEDPEDKKPEVKSGCIFDNFLLTNNEEFAEEAGNKTWGIRKDIEKQLRELYKEMEKRKQEKEAKKKKEKEEEREDDIWGIEEGSEEDSAEDPGNYRQLKEDDDERVFLGKNVEVHVDQRMNYNWVTSGYYSEANDVA